MVTSAPSSLGRLGLARPPLWTLPVITPQQRAEETYTQALSRLSQNPHFSGHLDTIQVAVHGLRLVVTGRVPSFYLKQSLQASLSDLPGVERIENRVDVVSCDGLSSEPS